MVRKSTSIKPTTTRKRQPKKAVKKSFLKRIRNIVIYSFIMIVIGAATAKYQTEIYDFVAGDYGTSSRIFVEFCVFSR